MSETASVARVKAAIRLAEAVDAWDAAIAGNSPGPTGAGVNHAAVVACCNVAKDALAVWRSLPPDGCPECKGSKAVSPHGKDIRGCGYVVYIKGDPVCACPDVSCPLCSAGAP